MLRKKNQKRKWFHKKRNPLRSAWRRTQGKSNKPFTPDIEIQNDEIKQKESYAV